MITFLKQLFCKIKHDYEYVFDGNIDNDDIYRYQYGRSIWVCKKCQKIRIEPYRYRNY